MRRTTEPGAAVLVVLAMTAVLSPVSMDMLTPSLPGLASTLGASPQRVELTLYAFLIGYGVSPSLWGALSDRVGRRPVMFVGMVIYATSSVAGVVTDSADWLIATRFLQGIGAGAGATVARAVVRDLYGAAGTTHGMAQLIALMAVVPFFMPLLGGALADLFSFRACFIAMALIGAASTIAFALLVSESRPPPAPRAAADRESLWRIVSHPVFAQHAICNMFCIGVLVVFGANFAFITAHHFGFDSGSNGPVLALFNGAIAVGTAVARRLMTLLGGHRAILGGAAACALSWLALAGMARMEFHDLALYGILLVVAGAGCGVIMALCSGAALTPFSHRSGTASSLYLLIQSAGSSGLSLLVGLFLPKQLLPIALALAACACLGIAAKVILARPEERAAHG